MSLVTGGRIHQYQWTELPANQDVTNRVNELAEVEGQPIVASNFKYKWVPGQDMEEHPFEDKDLNEEQVEMLDEFKQDEQAPDLAMQQEHRLNNDLNIANNDQQEQYVENEA